MLSPPAADWKPTHQSGEDTPESPNAWKDLETLSSKLRCSNSHFLFSGTTLLCFYLKTGWLQRGIRQTVIQAPTLKCKRKRAFAYIWSPRGERWVSKKLHKGDLKSRTLCQWQWVGHELLKASFLLYSDGSSWGERDAYTFTSLILRETMSQAAVHELRVLSIV